MSNKAWPKSWFQLYPRGRFVARSGIQIHFTSWTLTKSVDTLVKVSCKSKIAITNWKIKIFHFLFQFFDRNSKLWKQFLGVAKSSSDWIWQKTVELIFVALLRIAHLKCVWSCNDMRYWCVKSRTDWLTIEIVS